MEVLILSDSHGRSRNITEVLARQKQNPDLFIHLGDGLRDLDAIDYFPSMPPFYAVKGNCDAFEFSLSFPCHEEDLLALGGHTAFLTHGARYGVKGGLGALLAAAAQKGADLVLYGHTHTPHLEILEKGTELRGVILQRPMYVFNPGSLAQGSFGTLTIRNEQVLFSHGEL